MTMEASNPKIARVGVELEGGWRRTFPDLRFVSEASVDPPPGYRARREHWGELVSPPMERAKVEAWVREHYPDDIPAPADVGTRAERSCGLHIHVSFTDLDYLRECVGKKFHNFMRGEFKRWGEMQGFPEGSYYWYRWEGKNRFCTADYQPGPQMEWMEKGRNRQNRRSMLNYPLYYKTVEWRMLPMFPMEGGEGVRGVDKAVSAIHHYLSAVERWLEKVVEKERLFEAKVLVKSGDHIVEREEV